MIGRFRASLLSMNVNSFLFVVSIFGADWGICLIADSPAMCMFGFHCLCADGLSASFIIITDFPEVLCCFLTI